MQDHLLVVINLHESHHSETENLQVNFLVNAVNGHQENHVKILEIENHLLVEIDLREKHSEIENLSEIDQNEILINLSERKKKEVNAVNGLHENLVRISETKNHLVIKNSHHENRLGSLKFKV